MENHRILSPCHVSLRNISTEINSQNSEVLTGTTLRPVIDRELYYQSVLPAANKISPVIRVQCECEQSLSVCSCEHCSLEWVIGRACGDSKVHLSPINLCLYLCVSQWTQQMSSGLNHDRLAWWEQHPEKTQRTTGDVLEQQDLFNSTGCVYLRLAPTALVLFNLPLWCTNSASLCSLWCRVCIFAHALYTSAVRNKEESTSFYSAPC